jgi:RNA polymerase sigma-70 factor (ECF subfamily)
MPLFISPAVSLEEVLDVYLKTNRKRFRSPEERVGTLSNVGLPPPANAIVDLDEHLWVQALRNRDETAFERLVDRYHSPMFRLAIGYVRSRDEAEEVIQETWLGVLSGLERFEGRSSLKTWIFRILVNRARTRAKREARTVPLSSLRSMEMGNRGNGEAVDAVSPLDRINQTRALASGGWGLGSTIPTPDDHLLGQELRDQIDRAIGALPQRQREVITLRDLEEWSAAEVRDLLEISEANQRVLLHRARLRVRDALLPYLAEPARGNGAMKAAVSM